MNAVFHLASCVSGCSSIEPSISLIRQLQSSAILWLSSSAPNLPLPVAAPHLGNTLSMALMSLFVVWLVGGLVLYADNTAPANREADQSSLAMLISLEDLAIESEVIRAHKRAA